MAENTETAPKQGIRETVSKHKVAFGVAIVAVVAVIFFLWNRNNQSQNPNQLTGSNSLVPSAVAVPGPAGPTGPQGPRGFRGQRGPDDRDKHKIKHHHKVRASNRPDIVGNRPPAHMMPTFTAGLPAFPSHNTFHPQNPQAKR